MQKKCREDGHIKVMPFIPAMQGKGLKLALLKVIHTLSVCK